VGDDALGHGAMALFAQGGVDTTFSRVCKDMPTGVGFILVDDAGENQITLDTGACKCMDAAFALAASDAIRACDTLLMQLETPLDGVLQAARLARDAGIKTIS
jgi:ribokinase